jgi:hypothetical protein
MNEREHNDAINFAASQWTMIIVDDLPEATELILLAASYGPAINER